MGHKKSKLKQEQEQERTRRQRQYLNNLKDINTSFQVAETAIGSTWMEDVPSPIQQVNMTQTPSTYIEQLRNFAQRYQLKDDFIAKFRRLGDFKVVMLADDSGSMNADAYTAEFLLDPYATIPTCFQELQGMVHCITDAIGFLSKNPMDLVFLNREGVSGVKSFEQIKDCFMKPPESHHHTPTVDCLKRIIHSERQILTERNLLIFIATDGKPTTHFGEDAVDQMDEYLEEIMDQYPNLYITFMACISDESLLKTMDQWARKYPRIGVVDAYYVECKEMKEKHAQLQFTHGDYITKALLVSIDPDIKQRFRDDSSDSDS